MPPWHQERHAIYGGGLGGPPARRAAGGGGGWPVRGASAYHTDECANADRPETVATRVDNLTDNQADMA